MKKKTLATIAGAAALIVAGFTAYKIERNSREMNGALEFYKQTSEGLYKSYDETVREINELPIPIDE